MFKTLIVLENCQSIARIELNIINFLVSSVSNTPSSKKEKYSSSEMIKWSNNLMFKNRLASTNFSVAVLSALDGLRLPLGWL